MKHISVPKIDLSSVKNYNTIDLIDTDFAILDNINNIPLFDYPSIIETTVFALCLKGNCKITINLNEYNICPNDMILLMPNQIVMLCEKSDDVSGLFIVVLKNFSNEILPSTEDMLSVFFYAKESPKTTLNPNEIKCLKEYHSFLRNKVKETENIYRKEIIRILLKSLFYEIANITKKKIPEKSIRKSRKTEVFESFLKTVVTHYKQQRSVTFYADKLYLTPKYLSCVIKEISGKSAGEWIDEQVILAAKALLKSSNMTIQEISVELNFANQSFFGKYFKQHTGISPKAYRKI